jgi:hypothetical protein
MTGYAMNQAQVYRIKGTRLATVKKFSERINEGLASGEFMPEDRLELLMPWVEVNADKYLYPSSYENHDAVFKSISLLEKQHPCNITFEDTVNRIKALRTKYGFRAKSAEAAKGVDWKATAHAIRITQQAIEILDKKTLTFPFDKARVEHLLNIKHGNVPFDDVAAELTELFDKLDTVKETTTLPAASQELNEKFEAWLKAWLLKVYMS